jgi:lipoprotein-releasing system permease protein
MKNVSLYIAKRYNTHTLLISMVLIVIAAVLAGTLIYISRSSFQIVRHLLFQNSTLGFWQNFLVYSLTTGIVLFQLIAVYLLFNRFLQRISGNIKLLIAFSISVPSLLISAIIIYLKLDHHLLWNCVSLLLISIGLLSFIFGILSFLFAKQKISGVNIISSIAVFAITIATCALFIILSVFSGLEKMNIQFFSNVNPDLKISPAKGKLIQNIDEVTNQLDNSSEIAQYSKVIEEKVSIEFGDKQDIAYIKGIGRNYNKVVKIDTTLVAGRYFDFKTPYEIISSDGVARRLQLYVDQQTSARLRMPKPGTGLITSENEAFNTAVANPVGVTYINDQYDKYIFSPIGLTRQLLQLPDSAAYSIEIRLKPGFAHQDVKSTLQKKLGNSVKVRTREDLDATFLKVMNVENLIIYLIFTLVIIIASFNLAGAIIIIIIDKKQQIQTMWSFGLPKSQIRKIFFQTGLLITLFSILFGLLLGTVVGVLQKKFSLVMANPVVPFPFEFTVLNYFIVIFTVFLIGGLVSYLVSRRLPN